MSDLPAIVVGTAAAACSIVSFAPQVLKIARERDASSVSLQACILTCVCFVLWTAYGVLTGAWPIIIANALALCMAAAVLVMKWRFRDGGGSGQSDRMNPKPRR